MVGNDYPVQHLFKEEDEMLKHTVVAIFLAGVVGNANAVCPKTLNGNYSVSMTRQALDQCPSSDASGVITGSTTCSKTASMVYTISISGTTATLGSLAYADQESAAQWQTSPSPAQFTYSPNTCTGTISGSGISTVDFVVANGGSQFFGVSGPHNGNQSVYSLVGVRQ